MPKFLLNTIVLVLLSGYNQAYAQDSLKVKEITAVRLTASVKKKLEQQPGNVTVINTAPYYQTNQTSIDIFKRTSGVRVRQNGGYGSQADFFINGITGKQVKFFIDGIPADHLGETQSASVLPLEQTERLEIYKGIVPIELGSDALGGAINIVTRKEAANVLDLTAAAGSFRTFRLNGYAKKYFGRFFYIAVSASHSSSANNYFIEAEVPNSFGNIELKRLRRFHNDYQFSNVKLTTGFANTTWCDDFSVELQMAATGNQLQHNLIMRQPYGEASFKNKLSGIQVRYQKRELLPKMRLNVSIAWNNAESVFKDTALSVYNWEGSVVDRRFTGGEISSSGNLLTTSTNVLTSRQIITCNIAQPVKISIANTVQYFNRTGEDPVAAKFYGFDLFRNPQSMLKNITGIGVESQYLQGRLLHSAALKYYYAAVQGNRLQDVSFESIDRSYQRVGYNTAFTWFFNPSFFVKASYERAYRLPDETELFGDLVLVRANPELVPEQSDNVNLNASWGNAKLNIEATAFYRNVQHTIFLPPSVLFSQYSSLLKMRAAGIELGGKYQFLRHFSVEANATYQDLRNRSFIDNAGINNERYFGARLPNIPYLFANAGIRYGIDSLSEKKLRLQAYWYTNYVNTYYLYWAQDGDRDLKNSIPRQVLHTTGVTITHPSAGWSFSIEAGNIFNSRAYDNFKVQLPGRSINMKLRFHISKPVIKQTE